MSNPDRKMQKKIDVSEEELNQYYFNDEQFEELERVAMFEPRIKSTKRSLNQHLTLFWFIYSSFLFVLVVWARRTPTLFIWNTTRNSTNASKTAFCIINCSWSFAMKWRNSSVRWCSWSHYKSRLRFVISRICPRRYECSRIFYHVSNIGIASSDFTADWVSLGQPT